MLRSYESTSSEMVCQQSRYNWWDLTALCKGGRVVTFTMERINDLSLDGEDINAQNVIFDLHVEHTERGTKLVFAPCYGLTGQITAESVSVAVDAN
jgi:hypothetical protein